MLQCRVDAGTSCPASWASRDKTVSWSQRGDALLMGAPAATVGVAAISMAGDQVRHERGALCLGRVVDAPQWCHDSRAARRTAIHVHRCRRMGTRFLGVHPRVVPVLSDHSKCAHDASPQPSATRTSRDVLALASEPRELELLDFSLPPCLADEKSGEGVLI